jgi:hypothetical protein
MLANDYVLESVCILPLNVNDYVEVYSATTADSSYTIMNVPASQLTIARLPTTSEQVFRVGAPGQGWTAYTPSTTGFGTISAAQFLYRCSESTLFLQGRFTLGTVTSDIATVSLPSGYTIRENITQRIMGQGSQQAAGLDLKVLGAGGDTNITFGNAGSSSLSSMVGTSFTSASVVAFEAAIPVTANSPCPAAPMPQLKHAVTTSSEGVERVERALVTSCPSNPCTISSQSGGFASIVRFSTGYYQANFVNGTFSGAPSCTVNIVYDGAGPFTSAILPSAPSSSAMEIQSYYPSDTNGGITSSDNGFSIICMGPR